MSDRHEGALKITVYSQRNGRKDIVATEESFMASDTFAQKLRVIKDVIDYICSAKRVMDEMKNDVDGTGIGVVRVDIYISGSYRQLDGDMIYQYIGRIRDWMSDDALETTGTVALDVKVIRGPDQHGKLQSIANDLHLVMIPLFTLMTRGLFKAVRLSQKSTVLECVDSGKRGDFKWSDVQN